MRISTLLAGKGDSVATITAETTVTGAVDALREHGVGALVVSSDQTVAGDQSAVVGRIEVPVWPLKRPVSLVSTGQLGGLPDPPSRAASADSLILEFVVDERGQFQHRLLNG